METTQALRGAITSARGVDPRHPGLPFMEAAAEILEEHELRLGILSGHIIPARCKPHCVRCDKPAAAGHLYCEQCVPTSRKPDCAGHKQSGHLLCERNAAREEIVHLRALCEQWREQETEAVNEVLGRARSAFSVLGDYAVHEPDCTFENPNAPPGEGATCSCGLTDAARSMNRILAAREVSLRDRVQGQGEANVLSQTEVDALLKATEEWDAEEAEVPQAKYGGPGTRICPTCHQVPTACTCVWMSQVQGEEESKGEGGCTGTAQEPGAPASPSRGACGREASSPAAPSLREEVLAFLDGWGVGAHTTCWDAVSEVLDAWEARHRKLHKAAQAVILEAPKSVCRLRGEGCPGHASILEAVTDRLESALKEAADATL